MGISLISFEKVFLKAEKERQIRKIEKQWSSGVPAINTYLQVGGFRYGMRLKDGY